MEVKEVKQLMKRVECIFITTLVLFAGVLGGLVPVFAENGVINNLIVQPEQIAEGESFEIKVEFGGPNTHVRNGQKEEIVFQGDRANAHLPTKDIVLNDTHGISLGTVTFHENKAVLQFNEYAAHLDHVVGEFSFSVFGSYGGNKENDGSGFIHITYPSGQKSVELLYRQAGEYTDELYNKSGVWREEHPEGNRVDWAFIFNAAHRPISHGDYKFEVVDQLPETMLWDHKENEENPFAVNIQNHYLSLAQAKAAGIDLRFDGNRLFLCIPGWLSVDGKRINALDGKEIMIRLTAIVKDEVMSDTAKKEISNHSDVNIQGLDWQLNPKLFTGFVKIQRSGGWAQGSRPGELKLIKKLSGTDKPLQGVHFLLQRKDQGTLMLRGEDGRYTAQGKQIELITDEHGFAGVKGLEPAVYILRESQAPAWIVFDEKRVQTWEFEVSGQDIQGHEIVIENAKKQIERTVSKEWKDVSGNPLAEFPHVKVGLFRNGKLILQPVTLDKENRGYSWKGLDLTDDQGNVFDYTIRELDEHDAARDEGAVFEIAGKRYRVHYSTSLSVTSITNEEVAPALPLATLVRPFRVRKEWRNAQDMPTSPPVSKMKVLLYKNDLPTSLSLELGEFNNWEANFEGLAVSDDGHNENRYSVREIGEVNGKVHYSSGNTFTNRYEKSQQGVNIVATGREELRGAMSGNLTEISEQPVQVHSPSETARKVPHTATKQ